ncbi:hypothetical protein [Saccharopolyspora sp. NPDC049426]|uniref:hypothetical protein n=1 Tax=Saccharopolyspora sp. NPDC049426 TaxID=3155652 RepID=UPI003415BCF7
MIPMIRTQVTVTVVLVAAWLATSTTALTRFVERVRFDDRGSESTEKAVLTAIALAAALGLGAAITAVVQKYQAQIH